MAEKTHLGSCFIYFVRLAVFACLFMSLSKFCAVGETTSNGKDGALTVLEIPADDDANDAVVSDEPDGENGATEEREETWEMFVPTNEWRKIKKGQRIPGGLHVRMNIQTGEREAKLMDGESADKDVKRWDAGKNIGIINAEKQRFTRDELKKVVKDFKIKDMDSKQPQDKEDVKQKYRSYDELKKALKDMQMNVKTEAEIVTELVNSLKRPEVNKEDIKTLLLDLQYYLHQIDNARLFCDLDGMKTLLELMNNTDEDIRAKAAHTLGAAVQSNGKVQVEAVESGVLQHLIKIVSVDPSFSVRKKSLFALSALLRQFPFSQKKFLDSGGMSALTELFLKSPDQALKVKVVTLLTDLVQERDQNAEHTSGDEIQKARSRQYTEVKIREAMYTDGWCMHLTSLLEELTEHDDLEKTLSAMSISQDVCSTEFSSSLSKLRDLSTRYKGLAKEEGDDPDNYFNSIYATVQTLLGQIRFSREDL